MFVSCDQGPNFDLFQFQSNATTIVDNINTVVGTLIYNSTLGSPVTNTSVFANISIYVAAQQVAPAIFTVTLNGVVNPTVYTNNPGHNFVLLSPFLAGTNTIIVNITQLHSLTNMTDYCNWIYTFTILNPAASLVGDPVFVGMRGQKFQVHGNDEGIYNLITDQYLQVNAVFTFLERGNSLHCPFRSTACWTHPGNYITALGIKANETRYHLIAGRADEGFDFLPDERHMERISNTELTFHVPPFTLVVENVDNFMNLRSLRVDKGQFSKLKSHGLIGQTWRSRALEPKGDIPYIDGDVDDYVVSDVFGDDFVFNRYLQQM